MMRYTLAIRHVTPAFQQTLLNFYDFMYVYIYETQIHKNKQYPPIILIK